MIIPTGSQEPGGSVTINLGAKGRCRQPRSGEGTTRRSALEPVAIGDSPAWRLVKALDGHTPAVAGFLRSDDDTARCAAGEGSLVNTAVTTYNKSNVTPMLWPRLAGSWPGVTFTGPPLNLPAGQFGMGVGGGAHAPNEFWLIDSTNPKVAGMDGVVKSFVDLFYELA